MTKIDVQAAQRMMTFLVEGGYGNLKEADVLPAARLARAAGIDPAELRSYLSWMCARKKVVVRFAGPDLIGIRLRGKDHPSAYQSEVVEQVNACAAVLVYFRRYPRPIGDLTQVVEVVAAFYDLDKKMVKKAIKHLLGLRASKEPTKSVPRQRRPPSKPRLTVVPTPKDLPPDGTRQWYLERLRAVAVRLGRPPAYLDLMRAEATDGFPIRELYKFWSNLGEALSEAGVTKADGSEVA